MSEKMKSIISLSPSKSPEREQKKISITTKTGDKGRSRLFSGECVSKNSPRLDAYGDVDELACVLGVARCHLKDPALNADVLYLQRTLSTVAAELATSPDQITKLKDRIDKAKVNEFERKREELETRTVLPKGFIVSGDHLESSYLDWARTVARRCERKAALLFDQNLINNECLLVWLNRLSDYLYLMARFVEKNPRMVKE